MIEFPRRDSELFQEWVEMIMHQAVPRIGGADFQREAALARGDAKPLKPYERDEVAIGALSFERVVPAQERVVNVVHDHVDLSRPFDQTGSFGNSGGANWFRKMLQ